MKTYTPAELRDLADSRRINPFFVDEVRAALHYAANVLEAADAALTAERQRAEQGDAKDAERYRFVRRGEAFPGSPFIARSYPGGISQWTDEVADRFIDEAILASKPAAGEGK